MSEVYSVSIRPFYDSINQKYTHIFVIDRMPNEPLKKIARTIHMPRLSPFETFSESNKCVIAIYNPFDLNKLLEIGEEPIFFTYLLQNGYKVDTSLTKLMFNNPKEFKLLCMITKI